MGEPSIDTLHDPYEDQLSAARYKAERDAAVQELQGLRERNLELWMESGMANELVTCAEEKAERMGKLVWRLQNRLARAHRREKAIRKGMREWREKAIGGPVRTVSAYDLLPEADLETLRWVREQGGLDSVKKLLDWVVGHCSTKQQLDFDFWLSGRVMYELGFDEDMADRDEVERRLLARLMPEGCEWPRYEDGARVKFGDVVSDGDETGRVYYVTFDTVNPVIIGFTDEEPDRDPGTWLEVSVSDGECVKRPVPAADGKPLEVGQTVWDTDAETDTPLTVVEVSSDLVRCEYTWKDGKTYRPCYPPDQLTHTKPEPDSWSSVWADVSNGNETPKGMMRRCRALAGVSE